MERTNTPWRRTLKSLMICALSIAGAVPVQAQYWTINTCSNHPVDNSGSNVYGPMRSTATANATNRTAVIYPASQLTGISGQTLNNLYLYRTTTTGTMGGTPSFKVYLKEVANADWGSTSLSWATATTGATLVYDGNPAAIVGNSEGWKNFPLSANFTYSGTQNLAVFFEYTNPAASTAIEWAYEFSSPCVNTNNDYTTKYTNNTTGTLPGTLSSSNYRRPYIGFDYVTGTCSGTPVAGTLNTTSQILCSGVTPAPIYSSGYSTGAAGLNYQWEESNDDGASDPWAPVSAGSGGNTTIFFPPAFTGGSIYYRLVVTCLGGGGTDISASSAITEAATPVNPASGINFTNINNSGFTINWTNGSGNRRYVVINSTNSFTDPTNGTAGPVVAGTTYTGSGEQIVYDGTGTNVTVKGLNCNTTYYARVYEYQRCGTAAPYNYYFNIAPGTGNPNSQATTTPATASLPAANNFAGFTGSNLATVAPGWYEAAIATTGGTNPSHSNPNTGTSSWTNSTVFSGVTTAFVNLYTNTRNEWIVSPIVNLGTTSRLKFKAAITNHASSAADPAGMQGTDDSVLVMVSTDGCGAVWTPVQIFTAANTTTLTNVLTTYMIPLTGFTGQNVQIAFQATDGPADNTPDYDFHIADVTIEAIPVCDEPTALQASSPTHNTVNLAWTASSSGPSNGYEYYVATSSTAPTAATIPTGTTGSGTLIATATGLAATTTYFAWVRANCGTDQSAWNGPVSFTTTCAPVYTAPYTNNFVTFPNCWTESKGGLNASTVLSGTTSGWTNDDWLNTATNGEAAKINIYAAAKRDWLISPSFDLGTAGNLQIEFDLAFLDFGEDLNLNLGSDDTLAVVISTDNGATWPISNILQVWTAANSGTASQHITIPLAGYTGSVKIGFYGSEGTVNDANDVDVMVDNFQLTIDPLAVTLSHIAASNSGNRNRIEWTTATEERGDVIEIERSTDGQQFSRIATVSTKGTPSAYSHWDEQPATGVNYYRLKLVDASGSYSYSKVVTATVKENGLVTVEAYPNPAGSQVNVKLTGNFSDRATIMITDITGKTLVETAVNSNLTTVDLSALAPGAYLLRYSDRNYTQMIKLIRK